MIWGNVLLSVKYGLVHNHNQEKENHTCDIDRDAYNMHSESNLVNFSIQTATICNFTRLSMKNDQDMLEKKRRKSI